MFQNYALYTEQLRYSGNNYAIFEEIAIDDFMSRVDPTELEKAIKYFANNPDAEKRKGGVTSVQGKKVRISFVADPQHPGDYIAKFAYVDNPNAVSDIAELIYIGVRGMGTDEDAVYAVASAYRAYCQDTGKDEVTEMAKVATEYKKKYGESLYDALWDDFNDSFDRDQFDNFLMRGLYVQGPATDVGANYAKRIVDYTKPAMAASMLSTDLGHSNAIRFLLGCPLKYLPPIDATFKQMNDNRSILDMMKETKVPSNVRDLINSYFMGAGLSKKDDKFTYATRVISEGPKKIDTSYDFQSSGGNYGLTR